MLLLLSANGGSSFFSVQRIHERRYLCSLKWFVSHFLQNFEFSFSELLFSVRNYYLYNVAINTTEKLLRCLTDSGRILPSSSLLENAIDYFLSTHALVGLHSIKSDEIPARLHIRSIALISSAYSRPSCTKAHPGSEGMPSNLWSQLDVRTFASDDLIIAVPQGYCYLTRRRTTTLHFASFLPEMRDACLPLCHIAAFVFITLKHGFYVSYGYSVCECYSF